MEFSPIVLFAYNRPVHTQKTLDALSLNTEAKSSYLYIFCDGPKSDASSSLIELNREVAALCKKEDRFLKVIVTCRDQNLGLAKNVTLGVSEVLKEHKKVIVIEDDLLCSKHFLKYMNDGLLRYANEESVMSISAFSYLTGKAKENEAMLLPCISSWGWGTWAKDWMLFDRDLDKAESEMGKNKVRKGFNLGNSYDFSGLLLNQIKDKTVDSWAIRWWWTVFYNKGLCLFPRQSLVQNIGLGDQATHTKNLNIVQDSLDEVGAVEIWPEKLKIDKVGFNEVQEALKQNFKNIPSKDSSWQIFKEKVKYKLSSLGGKKM